MDFSKGIQSFVEFLKMVSDNWVMILVCIGLIELICVNTRNYLEKSDEAKIDVALEQVKQVILRMVTDAEAEYKEWNKAGSIKRAQVIDEIFYNYPILSKMLDQDKLVSWIDEQIDAALGTLREIFEKNKE